MKKSELKALIKECLLEEGQRQGSKELGDLFELLKDADWTNLWKVLADDAKLDKRVEKLSVQLYKIINKIDDV
jgi:hypothetical protein